MFPFVWRSWNALLCLCVEVKVRMGIYTMGGWLAGGEPNKMTRRTGNLSKMKWGGNGGKKNRRKENIRMRWEEFQYGSLRQKPEDHIRRKPIVGWRMWSHLETILVRNFGYQRAGSFRKFNYRLEQGSDIAANKNELCIFKHCTENLLVRLLVKP